MGSAPPIWGSSPRARKAFSVLGYLIVGASIVAQLCLVAFWAHILNLGPGEERAFASMALIALCVASLFVVVPGTLVAVARASLAFRARKTAPGAYASILFHAAAAFLPVLAIGFALFVAAIT